MCLKIAHLTEYHYDQPVPYALQQLCLRPKSRPDQNVIHWQVAVEGGTLQVSFEDEHANAVDLISFEAGVQRIVVRSEGEVEVSDAAGVVGRHTGFAPLWLFRGETALTKPGPRLRALLAGLDRSGNDLDDLDDLHALSHHILNAVPYSTDQTETALGVEQVLGLGHGVCQDHARLFIAAARAGVSGALCQRLPDDG
jgi:transglutaminase-like putative cysteine protease